LIRDRELFGRYPTVRMEQHQRRNVHQIFRTGGLELQADQALEVDDA
jgi:hypothetical protein